MICTTNTALPIVQCAGTVHVGQLVTGSDWTLRVVNVASGRMEYVLGTGDIDLADFDFAPGCVYALSLTDGDFKPFASEGVLGADAVGMIYVKVDKAFQADGTLYTPSEQWIIWSQ
jgi:hypothetical protein